MDSSSIFGEGWVISYFFGLLSFIVALSGLLISIVYQELGKVDEESRKFVRRARDLIPRIKDELIAIVRDINDENVAETILFKVAREVDDLDSFVNSYEHGFEVKERFLFRGVVSILFTTGVGVLLFFFANNPSEMDEWTLIANTVLWLLYGLLSIGGYTLYNGYKRRKELMYRLDELQDSLNYVMRTIEDIRKKIRPRTPMT